MREEPFGPIASINRFADLDDAIARGQRHRLRVRRLRVHRLAARPRERVLAELRASNIGINQMAPSLPDAPLGGMQASGVGYEGGRDGIAAFQHLG